MNKKDIKEVDRLFRGVMKTIKLNYPKYQFFKERDIVWTIQKELMRKLPKKYQVITDCSVPLGSNRNIADIAICNGDEVILAAEFKYEPNHNREGFLSTKFPIVSKSEIKKDMKKIRDYVMKNHAGISYFYLIDEGSYFKDYHANSEKWGKYLGENIHVLVIPVFHVKDCDGIEFTAFDDEPNLDWICCYSDNGKTVCIPRDQLRY